MAARNAPAAIQARGQLRTGRAALRSAYAAFLPSLTLSAGSTRQYTSGANTRIDASVITSYSIHYTKLYDPLVTLPKTQ